jgi:hypothetical protein
MRHYSLVLVHALDNPPFPNAKYKCDIINWGYMMRSLKQTLIAANNVAFVLCIWEKEGYLSMK